MTTLSVKLAGKLRAAMANSGFDSEEAFLERGIELAKKEAAEAQATLRELGEQLRPALEADESEFVPFDIDEIMASAKERNDR